MSAPDYQSILTVFLFFFFMVVTAVVSARAVASWQNEQTRRQISRGFDEIRKKLDLRRSVDDVA